MNRGALRTTLDRAGLLPALRRCRELLWTARFFKANRAFLRNGAPDGSPIPPAHLRILVAASPDIAWFLDGGRRGARSVREILERNGIPFPSVGPMLDFGCGCGRVLRNLVGTGAAIHGSDLNPKLINWCRLHLKGASFGTNDLRPPLALPSGQFGLVYSLSVFTHLPEWLQSPWLEELARVLRPGGHLILSTHGSWYLDQLTPGERAQFESGRLVVRHDDRPGSNACGAYHPEAYVRGHVPKSLGIVAHIPQGALGNPFQDLWLFQRT